MLLRILSLVFLGLTLCSSVGFANSYQSVLESLSSDPVTVYGVTSPSLVSGKFTYSPSGSSVASLSPEEVAKGVLGMIRSEMSVKPAGTGVASSTIYGSTHIRSYTDSLDEGATIVRLNQTVNGIPVFGGDVAILVSDTREVTRISGAPIVLDGFDIKPTLSLEAARRLAQEVVKGRIDDTISYGLRIYMPKELSRVEPFLVYYFDVYTQSPYQEMRVLVDAHTGRIMLKYDNVQTLGTIRTYDAGGHTQDEHGDADIHTFDDLVIYNDVTSNVGLYNTFPSQYQKFHDGLEKTYNYFKDAHGYLSFDNRDSDLNGIVRAGGAPNAFWSTRFRKTVFGMSGDVSLGDAVDIVGHEIAHGVTATTARLFYFSQSGALNESYSDIFGEMVEGDDDEWIMGTGVLEIRSLSNPNAYGHPMHMDQYYTGMGDGQGVHINSGIPNHAFYLLAQLIGRDKAADIFFLALTRYLVSRSFFIDARYAWIQSAIDIDKKDGVYDKDLEAHVRSALDAVGITPYKTQSIVSDTSQFSRDVNIYQTEHPYRTRGIVSRTFTKPNAKFMQLYIKNFSLYFYDSLRIYDPGENALSIADDRLIAEYKGDGGFFSGESGNFYSDVVSGNSIRIEFVPYSLNFSGYVNNYYGFDIDLLWSESAHPQVKDTIVKKTFSTAHPVLFSGPYHETLTLSDTGAKSFRLHFSKIETSSSTPISFTNDEGLVVGSVSGAFPSYITPRIRGDYLEYDYAPGIGNDYGFDLAAVYVTDNESLHISTVNFSDKVIETGTRNALGDISVKLAHFPTDSRPVTVDVYLRDVATLSQKFHKQFANVLNSTLTFSVPPTAFLKDELYKLDTYLTSEYDWDARSSQHFYPKASSLNQFVVSDVLSDSLTLKWNAPKEGERYYKFRFYKDGTLMEEIITSNVAGKRLVSGLSPETNYDFSVENVLFNTLVSQRTTINVTTLSEFLDAAPTGESSIATDNAVSVFWTPPVDPTYKTVVKIGDEHTATLNGDIGEYSLDGLTNDVALAVSLRFYDPVTFRYSLFTTFSVTPKDSVPPAKIRLDFSDVSDRQVTVNWTPPTTADLAFVHFYVNDTVLSSDKTLDKYIIKGATNGEELRFKWVSEDDDGLLSGDTLLSLTPRDITPPLPPIDLVVVTQDNQVGLSWVTPFVADIQETRLFIDDVLVKTYAYGEPLLYTMSSLVNEMPHQVKIVAVDDDGLESAALIRTVFSQDTVAPQPPSGLSTVVGDNAVTLNWVNAPDSDLSTINVYINDVFQAEYKMSEVPQLILKGLTNGDVLSFSLESVDDDGLKSSRVVINATPIDLLPPQRPSALSVVATDNRLTFTWQNPTDDDFSYTDVYLDDVLQRPTASDRTSITFSDLNNGQAYQLKLVSVDDDALESTAAELIGVPQDLVDPDPVTSVVAEVTDNAITVSWVAPNTLDLATIQLYLNGVLAVTYDKDASMTHRFDALTNGTLQQIDVYAVDDDNRLSTPVRVTLASEDSIAPAPVHSMQQSVSDNRAVFSWQLPNTADLAFVDLYKDGVFLERLSKSAEQRVTFDGLINGQRLTLRANTVDDDGLKSEDRSISAVPVDTVAPRPPTAVAAIASDNRLTFSWQLPNTLDLSHVLYRVDGSTIVTLSETAAQTLVLNGLVNGQAHAFEIASVDDDGLKSPTVSITAKALDSNAPNPPRNLQAVQSDNTLYFTWDESTSSDLAYTEVFFDNVFNAIYVPGTVGRYNRNNLVNNENHTIKIRSVDDDELRSDFVSLTSFSVDKTAPQMPSNLAVESRDNGLTFTWQIPDDSDLVSIEAFINFESVGVFLPSQAQELVLDNLNNGQLYELRLVSKDDDGLTSPMAKISGYPIDRVAPASPKNVQVSGGDNTLSLSFEYPDDSDFDLVRVLKNGSFFKEFRPGDTPLLSLSGLTNGEVVSFSLFSVDDDGLLSPAVDISGAANDSTRPSSVSNVSILSGDNRLELSWQNPVDPDFASVRLFMDDVLYRQFSKTDSPAVTLTALDNEVLHTFKWVSVDDDGLVSDEVVRQGQSQDTLRPDPPTNVSATVTDNMLRFTWNNPNTLDFTTLNVSIDSVFQEAFSKDDTPAYTLFAIPNGVNYEIKLVAQDDDGLLSDPVFFTAQALDSEAPASPILGSVTVGDNTAQFTWSFPDTADISHISASMNGVALGRFVKDDVLVHTATSLTNGETYTLSLQSEDDDGLASPVVTMTAIPTDTVKPAPVTGLSSTLTDNAALIEWTLPDTADLLGMDVYLGGVFQRRYLLSDTLELSLTQLDNALLYTVDVVSVDDDGLRSATQSITFQSQDNQSPQPASELQAVPSDNLLVFTWTNPVDADFTTMNVYLDDVFLKALAPNDARELRLADIPNLKDYKLSLEALDDDGLRSNRVHLTAFAQDRNAPAPPTALRFIPSDHEVDVFWQMPSDADFRFVDVYLDDVFLKRVLANEAATLHLDTADNKQVYRYSFVSEDDDGLRSEAVFIDVQSQDLVAPQPVHSTTVVASDNTLTYLWSFPTDSDFMAVDVTFNGQLSRRYTASDTPEFKAVDLVNGRDYTLELVAIDDDGLRSERRQIKGRPVDRQAPDAPSALSVTVSDNAVLLSWDNPDDADFSHVLVFYGAPLAKQFNKADKASFFLDGLKNGVERDFRLFAVDDDNLLSEAVKISATPSDVMVPLPVDSFVGSPSDNRVALKWTLSKSSDVKRLHLYMDGQALLTTMNLSLDHFTVTGLSNEKVYTFTIRVEDDDGLFSPFQTVSVQPKDFQAPLAPTGLAAVPSDNRLAFTWTFPTGRDVKSVAAYFDGKYHSRYVLSDVQELRVDGLKNGVTHALSLQSQDDDGLLSDRVTLNASSKDTVAPKAPHSVLTTVSDNMVAIAWQLPTDADLSHVQLLRDGAAVDTFSITDRQQYTFTGLKNGVSFDVTLHAIDDDGLSSKANTVTLASKDTVSPGAVSFLKTAFELGRLKVSWGLPKDTDVSSVKLYDNDTLLGTFSKSITSTFVSDYAQVLHHEFKVVVVDDDGLESVTKSVTVKSTDLSFDGPTVQVPSGYINAASLLSFSWQYPDTSLPIDAVFYAVVTDSRQVALATFRPVDSISSRKQVISSTLIAPGQRTFVAMKSRLKDGLYSTVSVSKSGFVFDDTPPTPATFDSDEIRRVSSSTDLLFKWTASDLETGVVGQYYAWGDEADGSDLSVLDYTYSPATGSTLISMSMLPNSGTKYLSLKVLNRSGLLSDVARSAAVHFDNEAPTIGSLDLNVDAKAFDRPDGVPVLFKAPKITLSFNDNQQLKTVALSLFKVPASVASSFDKDASVLVERYQFLPAVLDALSASHTFISDLEDASFYFIRATIVDEAGNTKTQDLPVFQYLSSGTLTAVNKVVGFPNPYNPAASAFKFRFYNVAALSSVDVYLYSLSGQEIRHLSFESLSVGVQDLEWDGRDSDGASLANGPYLAYFIVKDDTGNELLKRLIKIAVLR